MAKSSVYAGEVKEVTALGYSTNGMQRYRITVNDSKGQDQTRNVRKDCTANYDAKKLQVGDVVDLTTDGRGSVILIEHR